MDQTGTDNAPQGIERVIGSGPRLTIETVADFTQRLRQELATADTLVIEFDPEVEMDITALQVLCSASATARAEGKRFIRRGAAPLALTDLMAAAGIQCRERCPKNSEPCFFTMEGR